MKFIQVGLGSFGKTWLERVKRHRPASLVAIVDTSKRALKEGRDLTGLGRSRCFEDYRAAFESVEADAVLNVTPPQVHHEVTLAAFERGLPVLTEKPIADTMEHAVLMVQAAEQAGRTLMVSQNYRFRPWARTMQHLVRSEEFGPVDNVSVRFARCLKVDASSRLGMEHHLVRDMSIHHFDLMRALTGREPLSVYARTWRPAWSWFGPDPCAAALFDFDNGVRVVYEGSWVARGRETTWDGYWSVECPKAVIELRADRVHIISAEHPDQDTEVEIEKAAGTGQSAALHEFQQAVAEGREPETSGRDNLRSLAMSFAVMESSRTGQPVRIEDVMQGAGAFGG